MMDDPREQALSSELGEDQMEQGETSAESGLGPRAASKQNPRSTIQGTGDRGPGQ